MSSPLVANTVDAAALADELARFHVIDPRRLRELLADFSGGGSTALAEHLVRRGALTTFQADRALAGETEMLALGPYRLTGVAGQGTFGPLYRATHATKPGLFTVRVMPLRSLWMARQAKQLTRILTNGSRHPGVAPLIEVDSANGFHYLVWPEVEGERLSDRVTATGPLPPGEAVALLGHLANAVATCHEHGIAHGAITPHCVVLPSDTLPRLLELGAGTLLAQNLDADESFFDSMSAAFASAHVLTFGAPELATTPLDPTPASDQYALGAVGYFALTGLPPFPHPTLADQLRAKRTGSPPSAAIVNPDVSHELAAILERLMSPNPADRFASLAEGEERLSALTASEPSPSPNPPPIESLLLSRLHDARTKSGSIPWTASSSGVMRPPPRDDSDASITFDLPAVVEIAPDAIPAWTRTPNTDETPSNVPFSNRPNSPSPSPDFALPKSPASSEITVMAKRLLGSLSESTTTTPPPDPRFSAPTPVKWFTGLEAEDVPDQFADLPFGTPIPTEQQPPSNSVLWKKMKRNLLFWQAPRDPVQVSVFGPPAATPGQQVKLTLYLHTPDAAASVRTLSRAFQHDAELIGTGYVSREVARASELAVHMSVANAGIAKALMKFVWRGQPHRLNFDLHVPWESAEGASPGLVSIGLDDVRVGKIEFWLNVLPRKA